jgi:hypothetical protein
MGYPKSVQSRIVVKNSTSMQLSTVSLPECPSSLTARIYYDKRCDLTPTVRTKIALIAKWGKNHGRITRLSERFGISRTTVYALRDQLTQRVESAFDAPQTWQADMRALRESAIRQILLLRLTGHCCIMAISTILKYNGHSRGSTGFISETLHAIGDKLPQVIDYQGTVNWACDEIYHLGKVPILVSVEPLSGAVLQINIVRGTLKDGWNTHWQALRQNGIQSLSLISDEGWMLRAARLEQIEAQGDWDFQPDTFHAVSHRLGVFAKRLQKAAYQAIEAEYEREALCLDTKQPGRLPVFKQQWAQCQIETQKAIRMYEHFSFLYGCILQQFNIFDKNGLPRKRLFAEQEARCAIELMSRLDITGLDKELKLIDKLIPTLFNFLDKAQDCCQKMLDNQLVEAHALPFWALAWQYDKRSFKVKNNYGYQKKLRDRSKNWIQDIQNHTDLTDENFNALQTTVFASFDGIVQSSAAVEMFNSILRPFLNQSRDQLSQQALNLIMDFYNHKPFSRGKRKGKSPIEILTGKKQDKDWMDKIMDLVRLHNI